MCTTAADPIDPRLLAVMFDPFRRAGRRMEGRRSGLGLGLYISQQIVLAHRGEIAVESSDEKGTTFGVVLPRGAVGGTTQG